MIENAALEPLALMIVLAALAALAFQKLRQPTIVAYIFTGILLGPVVLDLISGNTATELFSELGLAFLLFLIGLEIKVKEIRQIVKPTVFIAFIQMAFTAALGYGVAVLLGFTTIESIIIAVGSMFSSTAVVVKLLSDRDEITTLPGKIDVGILLLQDAVVVLILALMGAQASNPLNMAFNLAEIGVLIIGIGSVSYFSSRYFLPRLFERISRNRHAFFVHGIAWAFLMISASSYMGISKEIGAFFAGLALGQIPYSQELQERVRPLTNFFIAVFFINVGLNLTTGSLTAFWKEALIASGILMVGKFAIIFIATDFSKFTPETSFKTAINMSQNSEFSLILGSLAVGKGLVGQEIMGMLSIMAIATMGLSSYLISYNSRIYDAVEHLLEELESEDKKDVEISELEDHAVVVGYDRLSKNVLRVLERHYQDIIVIDRNTVNTRELSESDYEYIYGDFKHPEIRKSARVKDADLVMCFSPETLANRKAVEESGKNSTVFTKAGTLEKAAELYEEGSHYVTVKNELAGEKMSEYLKLYLEDRDLFLEEIKTENQSIYWSDRDE